MKRRHQRREQRDRCLSSTIREKLGSIGASLEPMPSREYGRYQKHGESHIRAPPADTNSSVATSPTAVSPLYPKPSYSSIGAKSSEPDVERGLKPWVSTRRRYYEMSDDEDDDVPPPTPPPKPTEDRLRQVPYPSSIPDCIKMDRERSRSPLAPPKPLNWRNHGGVEQPRRAYSISSYYYDMDDSY